MHACKEARVSEAKRHNVTKTKREGSRGKIGHLAYAINTLADDINEHLGRPMDRPVVCQGYGGSQARDESYRRKYPRHECLQSA